MPRSARKLRERQTLKNFLRQNCQSQKYSEWPLLKQEKVEIHQSVAHLQTADVHSAEIRQGTGLQVGARQRLDHLGDEKVSEEGAIERQRKQESLEEEH